MASHACSCVMTLLSADKVLSFVVGRDSQQSLRNLSLYFLCCFLYRSVVFQFFLYLIYCYYYWNLTFCDHLFIFLFIYLYHLRFYILLYHDISVVFPGFKCGITVK